MIPTWTQPGATGDAPKRSLLSHSTCRTTDSTHRTTDGPGGRDRRAKERGDRPSGSRTGPDIARLLAEAEAGDREAFDRVFEVVYDDLRAKARARLRRSGPATLRTTELVHEAYLKLAGSKAAAWTGREHFLRVAATAMRHIVIDRARRHRAGKRGGGVAPLDIAQHPVAVDPACDHLLALDEGLSGLAARSPRAVEVVELTYFIGLSVEEAASVLEVSVRTVKRDRTFARAFLARMMSTGGDPTTV